MQYQCEIGNPGTCICAQTAQHAIQLFVLENVRAQLQADTTTGDCSPEQRFAHCSGMYSVTFTPLQTNVQGFTGNTKTPGNMHQTTGDTALRVVPVQRWEQLTSMFKVLLHARQCKTRPA
eukprot:scpid79925/ scgid13897/ 